MSDLLINTEKGLFCPAGGFYIDPWAGVDRAIVTHAHSDHAHFGSRRYLTAAAGAELLRLRLGSAIHVQPLDYRQSLDIDGVRVSLHPAGHVLGSSQVRIEHRGQVWVVSGDYKTASDPTCAALEPLRCHTFITESTFGLPVYRWSPAEQVIADIHAWWQQNQLRQRTSVLFAYALGKAQRLLASLDPGLGPILVHGAIERLLPAYRAAGIRLAPCEHADADNSRRDRGRALVLAPPSAMASPWLRKFGPISPALASGSMQIRGARRRRSMDRGFVLSDHADWDGLLTTIRATGAQQVWVTHGHVGPMVRWLAESGLDARPVATRFEGELDETGGGIELAEEPIEAEQHVQRFTQLYLELDRTNRTADKVRALADYFASAPPQDAAWALYFLIGRKIKRALKTVFLREWVAGEAHLPGWLVDESYDAVGDLAETLALLLEPRSAPCAEPLHQLVTDRVLRLKGLPPAQQRVLVIRTWHDLNTPQRLVWHKLIMGEFRVGVQRTLVARALAAVAGVAAPVIEHRLMGHWDPTADDFRRLLTGESHASDPGRPYPFYLAYPLDVPLEQLGEITEWQAEWKWDGIRAQLLRRQGQVLVWSRGEELVSDRFPEVVEVGQLLPDGTVLDGEVLAWQGERPLPFAVLQRRIGRTRLNAKTLAEAPSMFMAYDLLEHDGQDVRAWPLERRQAQLERLIEPLVGRAPVRLSPLVAAESWPQLAQLHGESRNRGVEGLMLKRLAAAYGVGRQRGDWWKWKSDPYAIDAVLIYAQRGHGRRASLYTDYTFGVWDGGALVPIAKAYSGLSDAEIREVDAFVRQHTVDRFGPVRVVEPRLVFELHFEGIQVSTRHKAGLAVRFPRMANWRRDKPAEEADTVDTVRALLAAQSTKSNPAG